MHAEMIALMQRALDGDAGAEERTRLESHLRTCAVCEGEWQALRRVEAQLVAAPMVTPVAGFEARVMQRIGARPRAVGSNFLGLTLVSVSGIIALGTLVALSPLDVLIQPEAWVALSQTFIALLDSLGAWLGILLTVARVVGEGPLFIFSLLALALTVIWTRLISGPVWFNQLTIVNGGTHD